MRSRLSANFAALCAAVISTNNAAYAAANCSTVFKSLDTTKFGAELSTVCQAIVAAEREAVGSTFCGAFGPAIVSPDNAAKHTAVRKTVHAAKWASFIAAFVVPV